MTLRTRVDRLGEELGHLPDEERQRAEFDRLWAVAQEALEPWPDGLEALRADVATLEGRFREPKYLGGRICYCFGLTDAARDAASAAIIRAADVEGMMR